VAQHFIDLKNESGHVVVCPLWKLPQLVADEVEIKKAALSAAAVEKERKEAQEKADAEARAANDARDADALARPFDLSTPGF
jgi:hypothetical protein